MDASGDGADIECPTAGGEAIFFKLFSSTLVLYPAFSGGGAKFYVAAG